MFSISHYSSSVNKYLIKNNLKLINRHLTTTPTSNGSNFITLGNSKVLHDLLKQDNRKVLYFTATWCPPCKKIAPIFTNLSKEFNNILFIKIDIDDFNDLAQEYGISSVPTFAFLRGSEVTDKVFSFIMYYIYLSRVYFILFLCLFTIVCRC